MITWPALTLPLTRAFSLMTRMLGPSPTATMSPCTSPSMRRPSLKRTSPCNTVPSPIRLRIGGCFLFKAHMLRFLSELHGLGRSHSAMVVEHPNLKCFYHGPLGMVEATFHARVLPQ